MKHGIDNLLKILEEYCTAAKTYSSRIDDAEKNFKGEYGTLMTEQYTSEMKARSATLKSSFESQMKETIASIKKDRATPKYIADQGFTNVLRIITSSGSNLDAESLRNLCAPYLDDHISVKSISAIIKQQGRDPEIMGIVPTGDPLEILSKIESNCAETFSAWSGKEVPMDSFASVIGYQLERAGAILDGTVTGKEGSISI